MCDGGFAAPLLSLIEDGVGLLLGTCDDDDVPRGTRAWGVRVVGDRLLRVTFSADDATVVANASTGLVAVTGADVRHLRSVQLKGRVQAIEEPDEDDLALAAEQTALFFEAIHETDRTEIDVLRRILPARMLAAVVEVGDAFDQTPGPNAGAALETGGGTAG
jgi:hypothetical protein